MHNSLDADRCANVQLRLSPQHKGPRVARTHFMTSTEQECLAPNRAQRVHAIFQETLSLSTKTRLSKEISKQEGGSNKSHDTCA